MRGRKRTKRSHSEVARLMMARLPVIRGTGLRLREAMGRKDSKKQRAETGALLPVRLLGLGPGGPVEVVTSSGHLVRGLSVEGAAALLRELA